MDKPAEDKTKYRKPTVKEGADFIEMCFTREYKFSCIAFWRRLYGDQLADQILNELRARKKKNKKEDLIMRQS
ncbi:hypothetical protein [Nitrosomonas sp. Is79A3]|uniref:hypothetical protein n=1 Tax=Nitrosomonas sp. (strain Is79A3) TaxID=261292 RepID=UPI00059D8FC1